MNSATVLASLAAGLLAGVLGNWAADHLPGAHAADAGRRWPPRVPLLMAAMVGAFLLTAWLLGPDPARIAAGWLYAAFLLTVLVIDFEQRRVLNIMLGPAAVLALAISFLLQMPTPQSALLGGLAGLGLFLLVYLLSRGKLGMGDVKLAGVIGLMLGYPLAINALLLGIILAAAAALVLLFTRRATRKSYMAYAPYLALGALLAIWWYW